MIEKISVFEVNKETLADHPQAICFINPKHQYYHKKVEWLKEQFQNGLKIKLLYLEGEKKPVGFIEYVPGEYCWRPVNAKGYMFIHCLWTNGKKFQHQGLGGMLIQEVEKDAENMSGVSVITSKKSFMATQDIFLKNGYTLASESEYEQLLVKQFSKGSLPTINNYCDELKNHTGLSILYSKQCPWVARFIEEMRPILEKEQLYPEIIELKTPGQAQNAPSVYGVLNLIYNGNILADRYISTTRFSNIIRKHIK